MASYLCCAKDLPRQLASMQTSGKKGQLAVEQCERILDTIRSHGPRHQKVLSKRTRYGETRVKNCVKYDLGHGYRMVTVLDGDSLYIPFVGSHDKTDSWIELHRTYWLSSPKAGHFTCEEMIATEEIDTVSACDASSADDIHSADTYEERLLARIDDRLLREIFHGLVQAQITADHSCEGA